MGKAAVVPVEFNGATDAAIAETRRIRRARSGQTLDPLFLRAERWLVNNGITDPGFPEQACPYALGVVMLNLSEVQLGVMKPAHVRQIANRVRQYHGSPLIEERSK